MASRPEYFGQTFDSGIGFSLHFQHDGFIFHGTRDGSAWCLDRFSRFFPPKEGICVNVVNQDQFLIPQGTLPWQPILGKIGEMTFIQHPGI